jgi:hypothetical protein
MRLKLTADCAGEVRFTLQAEPKRSKVVMSEARPALVCSELFQDAMSKRYIGPKPGYGKLSKVKRFTSLAKRRLREFGALVDDGPLRNCVFLTGTLPGSTPRAFQAIAEWSSWIVSRLSQWFRDRYPGSVFFGVWEYQRRGALHMHVCVRCPTLEESTRLKCAWKRRWIALLDGVGRKSGVDLFERRNGDTWQRQRWIVRTDAQTVEKSVARYLSKYTSKGAGKARGKYVYSPARWWFASQSLANCAREQRQVFVVSQLTLVDARICFEYVGAQLVAASAKSFPIFNKYDARYSGVIALGPSVIGGMLVRQAVKILSVLGLSEKPIFVNPVSYWRDVGEFFAARILTCN